MIHSLSFSFIQRIQFHPANTISSSEYSSPYRAGNLVYPIPSPFQKKVVYEWSFERVEPAVLAYYITQVDDPHTPNPWCWESILSSPLAFLKGGSLRVANWPRKYAKKGRLVVADPALLLLSRSLFKISSYFKYLY